jgi:hypothetical protein
MNKSTDGTASLGAGLAAYVRMVAGKLGVPPEATGFEISDTVTAYLALVERYPARPGQDLMLVWGEQHGWAVAVETDPLEPPMVLDYFGGDDIVPPPRAVALFVADVIAGRRVPRARPVYPIGRDRLSVRLSSYGDAARPGVISR